MKSMKKNEPSQNMLSRTGRRMMPSASVPAYIVSTQPSVVEISNKVRSALPMWSKLRSSVIHLPLRSTQKAASRASGSHSAHAHPSTHSATHAKHASLSGSEHTPPEREPQMGVSA